MPEPTATLLDDFTRADTGPPPSASWTNGILTFTGGEGLVVLSNACTRAAAGGFRQGSYWNVQKFGPNACLVVNLSGWVDTDNNDLVLYIRLNTPGSGTTNGYAVSIERFAPNTTWTLWRIDNAVTTNLTAALNQSIVAGDQLAVQMIGNTLEAWRRPSAGSWALVASATDGSYTAPGFVGAEITNGQQSVIDNFSAQTIIDAIVGIVPSAARISYSG